MWHHWSDKKGVHSTVGIRTPFIIPVAFIAALRHEKKSDRQHQVKNTRIYKVWDPLVHLFSWEVDGERTLNKKEQLNEFLALPSNASVANHAVSAYSVYVHSSHRHKCINTSVTPPVATFTEKMWKCIFALILFWYWFAKRWIPALRTSWRKMHHPPWLLMLLANSMQKEFLGMP